MLLLTFTAFVFGLLASLAFSAAPFIAGNILMMLGIIVLGILNGWSYELVAADLLMALVSLQAGYFTGIVGKLRALRRSERTENAKHKRGRSSRGASTMDRTH